MGPVDEAILESELSPTNAVYGGSFDPPTLGHLMVVTHLLLNDATVDEVLIPPCFQQRGKNLTAFEHRMRMCELQFGHLSRTKVTGIEQELGGESLTIRLIEELVAREPRSKHRFVMGADLTDTAPQWERWEDIERLAPPLIIGRAGISPHAGTGPTPISPIVSSTIVRAALAVGDYRQAERYLARPVLEYIKEHRLYL